MKIIDFPGAANMNKHASKKVIRETVPNETQNKILLGPLQYTCVNCNNVIKFEGENMIFKTIEAYCSKCGSLTKISNPAFTNKTQTNRKQN